MTIHDDLREVMGLLGKATPGPWSAWYSGRGNTRFRHVSATAPAIPGFCGERPIYIANLAVISEETDAANAALIVAAVNLLKEHGPALLARQEGEDADAVLAAMNDGYTVRKGLPAPYLTDAANAEFAWIIERAVPPFCDKKGVGMWHAPMPREAIAKARAAIEAARSGGGG